jgi:N-glycosylase/DNA lyase
MKKIVKKIEKLKNSEIKKIIDKKMEAFSKFQYASNEEIFLELCFCFMTANFQAKKSWDIQKEINSGFWEMSEKDLQNKLKQLGHRFWSQRGTRIYKARWVKDRIKKELIKQKNEIQLREWIVKNLGGLGMKEASHFLRNIGYKNIAIIDKHILNLLVKEKIIEKPKTITPKKYLEIENKLRQIANKMNLSLGELDLYLWYEETGKILK